MEGGVAGLVVAMLENIIDMIILLFKGGWNGTNILFIVCNR